MVYNEHQMTLSGSMDKTAYSHIKVNLNLMMKIYNHVIVDFTTRLAKTKYRS